MDLQSAITLTIEIIFWAVVIVMMADFIGGIFEIWYSQTLVPVPEALSSSLQSQAITKWLPETQYLTIITPQLEEITDPWTTEIEFDEQNNTLKNQPTSVLSFPTLNLLPPVQEAQRKPKGSITKRKSTATKTKSAKGESSHKLSRQRQKSA